MQPTDLLPQAETPPQFFYIPDGARFTLAEEVVDLMEAIGYQVRPEERLAACALFPQRDDGDWIGLDSGVVCPRQNLKTATGIAGAIHDTFVQGITVAWTAHEFKTSTAAFRDLQAIIEGHSWLSSEVLKVRTGSVDPGFELRNGARLDIIARTGKSGRGMARPRLYLDEGLYLSGQMMGAIVPTMSAMQNAHMVVMSSPGLFESDILRGYRKRGRSQSDPNLGWIEWSQEQGDCASPECDHSVEADGCWLDSLEAVMRVNPAAPRRISLDYIAQERRILASAPQEYLRERMGVWSDPPAEGSGNVFPAEAWTGCRDTASAIADDVPVAWGVDVSFARSAAHVVAFGTGPDGLPHGVLRHTCNPSDVVAYLATATAERPSLGVALQANGAPVSSLLPDMERVLSVPVVGIAGADLPKACGLAYDAVTSRTVRHRGQSQIDRAVAAAEARSLSDGWALDRKRSRVDIAPLVAWVHAYWLHQTFTAPADPAFFTVE